MENKIEKPNLHKDHRKRMRDKVRENGFSQFSDHELLEFLLFYSIPRVNTNEQAHELYNRYKSFDELLKADVEELKKINGVGENTAMMIAAVAEINSRANKPAALKKRVFRTTEDYKLLAINELKNKKVEEIVVFCLDPAGKLKNTVKISSGDQASAYIDVKEAVRAVIENKATKAVLAHNHPTGASEPSVNDIDATRSLCVMFRKLGVLLVDHIIVGESESAYSMYSDPDFRQMFY